MADDPFRHPRADRARRATVLTRLERHGPLGLRPGGPAGDRASRAPWFVGWVLDRLLDPAGHRFDALGTGRRARTARVFTGGLRSATTVDLRAQAAAERAVFAAPDRLVVGRHGRRPAWPVANYEGHGFGHATLRSATALSINTVYAGLLVRLGGGDADRGAAAMVRAAARLGGQPAAGGAERGPGHQRGHAPGDGGRLRHPGRRGRRAAPFGVRRITGPDGRVLYQGPARDRPGPGPRGGRDHHRRAPGCEAASGGRRPARPAPPRTMPTPGSWASPRPRPRRCGSATRRARCRWCRPGPPAGSRGTWPAASGPGSCGRAGRPAGRFPRPDTRLVQVALDEGRGCLPNRFTPAAEVASLVYLRAAAPTRTCREPEGPLAGVVPAVVGVPVARAAGWLEAAGLSLAQRLAVDGEAAPGTVLAQPPAGGTARPAGTPVTLTVAVDAQGAGGLG